MKEQFEKIHKLLGTLATHPKEKKEDYRPVHGEAHVKIRVGEGDDIAWAQARAGFIGKQPKFKEGLLQSISIAESMAGMPLSKDLE